MKILNLVYFRLFKKTFNFIQQIYVKKCQSSIRCRDSNQQPSDNETPTITTRYTSGQSYKHFTLINYDSRVVPDLKIPHITTLDSYLT